MKYHNEFRGKPRTLPRLGSWVRIPSPAPNKSAKMCTNAAPYAPTFLPRLA